MVTRELSLQPQQKRSRETVERLLTATVKVLDESGLEGAVIPRIAEAAGLAPASIYRRFADKDALLRAAFLYVLRKSNESNREHLKDVLLRRSLEETSERLMTMLFAQYRTHPHLLRGLIRFLDTDSDAAFRNTALGLIAGNLKETAAVLMLHRKEIRHPHPERALEFALLNAVSSIEAVALESVSLWHTVLPLSDKELAGELARGFVAYLTTDPRKLRRERSRTHSGRT